MRLSSIIAAKSYLHIPPHRKHIAKLSAKVPVFKKSKEKVDKANQTAVQDLWAYYNCDSNAIQARYNILEELCAFEQ